MEVSLWLAGATTMLGLLLGSFAGATVWRLRARQLRDDKRDGEKVSASELKRINKLPPVFSFMNDRSLCLHCGHKLAWYDLIPLVSWLQLQGKCRYCRHPIGRFEPMIEIGTAFFFCFSYVFWPHELVTPVAIISFGLWLLSGVGLIILFSYDAKWFLLPNRIMFPVIGLGAISAVLQIASSAAPLESTVSIIIACGILSGLYFILYIVSQGRWVGFGDIKLGLALALLLADWRLALLTLFMANFIGTCITLPALLTQKIGRDSRIPFGPMLIAAWFIAGLWGAEILEWYEAIALGW